MSETSSNAIASGSQSTPALQQPAGAQSMESALAAAAAQVSLAAQNATGGSQSPANSLANTDVATNIATMLKQQHGEQFNLEKLATVLQKNMSHFAKEGKLSAAQIAQVRTFIQLQMLAEKQDKSKQPVASTSQYAAGGSQQPQQALSTQTVQQAAQAAIQQATSYAALKPGTDAQSKLIGHVNPGESYPPITQNLNYTTNPGPVSWAPTRPSLTGGLAAGRISSTPAQVSRAPEDVSGLSIDDNRTRRKNSVNDQNMRRTIQDLVASVDPNVKVELEVEDLLLNIADEFIDSVTNFACRLAKHRGGDTLEVRDLQLHLERNHNIRIPGFASDETQISLSQSGIGPSLPSAAGKKNAQGQHTTLRAQRLAQVQQSKREAKLM